MPLSTVEATLYIPYCKAVPEDQDIDQDGATVMSLTTFVFPKR